MKILSPRFPLGRVVSTPAVLEILKENDRTASQLLTRHQSGDWGDLCEDDKQVNEEALTSGGRILSAYWLGGEKIWIITESDRSSTCIMLPSEY